MYKFKYQILPTNFNVFSLGVKKPIITAQGSPLEWPMLCPKQEQTMEFLILDIKVLRAEAKINHHCKLLTEYCTVHFLSSVS